MPYSGVEEGVLTIGLVFLLGTLALAPVQSATPVQTVARVDLDRYAGDWYEIARYPNRFQRQCTGDVRASYARRPDGRLDVINRCRTAEGTDEARGVARVVDENTSARLKVRFAPAFLSFLPNVWGDYWVVGLADDYSWAVVGSPDREYLWILSRTPSLDSAQLSAAHAAVRANGFSVEKLVTTSQSASRPTRLQPSSTRRLARSVRDGRRTSRPNA